MLHHITPLVIDALGVDTHTHTHTVLMHEQSQKLRAPGCKNFVKTIFTMKFKCKKLEIISYKKLPFF